MKNGYDTSLFMKRVPQVVFQNLIEDKKDKLKHSMREFYDAMNRLAEAKSNVKDIYFCQRYNAEDLQNLNDLKRDFEDIQIDSIIGDHEKRRTNLETEEKSVWKEYQNSFNQYKVQKRALIAEMSSFQKFIMDDENDSILNI